MDSGEMDRDEERLVRLEDALARMPRRQREIFRAHRLDDMSYEEIARLHRPFDQ